MTTISDDLRFPIGKFKPLAEYSESQIKDYISEIEELPALLRKELKGLSDQQLDTPYRPEGWTIRQVTHHLADSHINSLVRFKLALTEEVPTIKPYAEEKWAETADAKTAPVELSLNLLEALHTRWVLLLRSMSREQFARTFNHPVSGVSPLAQVTGSYAWHGKHHLAHITSLKTRMKW